MTLSAVKKVIIALPKRNQPLPSTAPSVVPPQRTTQSCLSRGATDRPLMIQGQMQDQAPLLPQPQPHQERGGNFADLSSRPRLQLSSAAISLSGIRRYMAEHPGDARAVQQRRYFLVHMLDEALAIGGGPPLGDNLDSSQTSAVISPSDADLTDSSGDTDNIELKQ